MFNSLYFLELISERILYKSLQLIRMQAKIIPFYFTDRLLFSSICEYLSIRQVLGLAVLNHQMHEVVEQHCRTTLKELHLRPSTVKSSIHQMQFYFNRCLRIVRQDKNINEKSIDLITINEPCKFETIKFFQVGSKISCYLTRNEKGRIFRTSQLLELYEQNGETKKQKKGVKPKCIFKNGIRDIRSKSEQCVITKTNGEVILLSINKQLQEQLLPIQQLIKWTTSVPIQFVSNSYGYSIFVPESLTSLRTLLLEVFNKIIVQDTKNQEQNENKIYLIARNMINNKQFIVEVPCAEILEVSVGSKYAYFISNKYQLFEVDLEDKVNQELPLIKARIFQPFKGINIVKISSGYNFFIALQRNLQQLQAWDTQRVVKWLRQIGFEAFIKIARYEKLDGKKLKNIQKKYMHNVLGITTQNMQQKFLMSIEQNLNKKSNNDQLWGWGKNQCGQLGSCSAVFISKPQKIRINCISQGQYIDSIFCGWFQTFVRTQKGRIYCTKVKSNKKRKVSQKQIKQESSEEEQTKIIVISDNEQDLQKETEEIEKKSRKKSRGNQNQGKKKKKNQQIHNNQSTKQKNNQKFKEQQNWQEFGLGKAFFVQAFKDILFIIQCPDQIKEEPIKIVKLRTAKAILDKILWSDLNKDEYKVGYMDKDMGLIETSALNMQKFEVKQNSIKYFKKGNTILWDRNSKTDFF